MRIEDCFYLGYVARVHGFKGELSFFLDSSQPQRYADLEFILVLLDQNLVPFPIEECKLEKGKYLRCRLVGVDTEEMARRMMKCKAYLPATMRPVKEDTEHGHDEIIGFSVEDSQVGHLGEVVDVYEVKGNPLIAVDMGEKEVLIPAHPDFIEEVDREKRVLRVICPEGLFDL